MFSAMQPFLGKTIVNQRKKPAIMKFYYFIKSDPDIIGQKMVLCTVKPRSFMWTLVALSYLLDTVRVNANKIYNFNQIHFTASNFSVSLTQVLVTPHVKRRSTVGLNKPILQKIFSLPETLRKILQLIGTN